MLAWISSSGFDVGGRLALQLGATVLFARWLSSDVFGRAGLTIVYVGVLSVFPSALFEEALTQRRVVRRAHFASALLVSLACSACGFAVALGCWLGVDFDSPDRAQIASLVAGFSVVLFADAPIAIYTAIARRHRAFKRIAGSNLAGQFAGTVVGLALALFGVGVWSLLSVRLVARFVTLVCLVLSSPVFIAPGYSASHLRQLSRFAKWHFASCWAERLSDAAFQSLVTKLFGFAGNGYLNMAMRIVEPIRGATGAIGHNIAMSFYVRVQDAPERLRVRVVQTVSGTALLTMPVFVGLAACSDSIVAVLAGPLWKESSLLAVCLALAAAITSPTDFLHTALSARGRADLGVLGALQELLIAVGALWLLAGWGLLAVGLARLLSYAGDAVFALVAARRVVGTRVRDVLSAAGPPLVSACLMGVLVYGLGSVRVWAGAPVLRLAAQVTFGVAIYGVLLALLHRRACSSALASLRR